MMTNNVVIPIVTLALVAILFPSALSQPNGVGPPGGAALPQPGAVGPPGGATLPQPGAPGGATLPQSRAVGALGGPSIPQTGAAGAPDGAAIPQPGAPGGAAILQPGAVNPPGGVALPQPGVGSPVAGAPVELAGPHFFDRPLQFDYYKTSCPNAEKIIADVINLYKNESSTVPGITRLLFHDCFITGCDASILLETSPSDQAEIAFPGNSVSIRGLDVIAHAKAELEKVCVGTVSCADILAYAARDCAVISGNPSYPVIGGRRDSLVSLAEDAKDLPGPDWPMDKIVAAFAIRNISLEGVVALLGAHSIGVTRCFNTAANKERMDNIPGADKALNPEAKKYIDEHCPSKFEGKVPLNLVNESGPWGATYFASALQGKVAIPSDLGLLMDPEAKKLSEKFAADPKLWAQKYNEAMMVLGTYNTLTNLHVGEIRTRCGFRNGETPKTKN